MTEDIGKMATLEREFEERFEKMCAKNGWSASANFLYGTETASMMLEKFSKEPVSPDDVWLTQARMVQLFGKDQSVISRHIRNAR